MENWEEQIAAQPCEWIADGLIAAGAVHLISGESGEGKTSFMTALAYAVSLGKPFAGRATRQRSVLVLDRDNPAVAVRDRCQRLDVHYHTGFLIWGYWSPEEPPSPGGAVILEWIRDTHPKPLILVHSSVSFHPGDENDAAATRQYMNQYRTLTKTGATVLVEHQAGKSDTARDYRGSSDYKAAVDIGWHVSNAGRDSGRLTLLTLRAFKQRIGVPVSPVQLKYEDGIFQPADEPKFKTNSERLTELLRAYPRRNRTEFQALAREHGMGPSAVRQWVDRGIDEGWIDAQKGAKNGTFLAWREKDEFLA